MAQVPLDSSIVVRRRLQLVLVDRTSPFFFEAGLSCLVAAVHFSDFACNSSLPGVADSRLVRADAGVLRGALLYSTVQYMDSTRTAACAVVLQYWLPIPGLGKLVASRSIPQFLAGASTGDLSKPSDSLLCDAGGLRRSLQNATWTSSVLRSHEAHTVHALLAGLYILDAALQASLQLWQRIRQLPACLASTAL